MKECCFSLHETEIEWFFGRWSCDLLVVLDTKLFGSLGGLQFLSLISYPEQFKQKVLPIQAKT